jgi:hypothetical protein
MNNGLIAGMMEIGERFSKNHLPWDEIDALPYKRYYRNFDQILVELQKKSAQRVAENKFFDGIRKEQLILQKYRKENRRSLNEKERYKEYFAEKKIQDETRKFNRENGIKQNDDGVLTEAVNIVADFSDILKRQK